ncbi:MAG TPA: hypothetical protein VN848_03370 [Gemmatimonadales bacterium]|nr:hypothetical protein [Gemmatimonadales bacterium]
MTLLPPVPFYTAPGSTTEPARRRLLLISYHYPPGQASGVLRWQRLTRYAAERGWALDAVTLAPADLPDQDPARLADLASGTRVYGVSRSRLLVPRLEALASRSYRVLRPGRPHERANRTSRPLRRALHACLEYARDLEWARVAAALTCRLFAADGHHAVISCGPPHMAHEAGRIVAARTGRPWLMDLRDPWSLLERSGTDDVASPVWYRLARRYERPAVDAAALVVMNSDPARQAMQRAYPAAAKKIIAVMNGFDEYDPPQVTRGPFTVTFAGSIYLDRDPNLLLRPAARAIRSLGATPDQFRIEFIGHADAAALHAMARAQGIVPYVSTRYFVPHGQLGTLLAQAAVLVSLNQDSDLAIPAKVFEYLQYDAWVLALAERGSATELVLRDTGADVVSPKNEEAIEATLRERYVQFAAGTRPTRLAPALPHLSRRAQADRLFDAIELLVSPTAVCEPTEAHPTKA